MNKVKITVQKKLFLEDLVKESGIAISSCNDGFRPVIFKLESTDIPSEK